MILKGEKVTLRPVKMDDAPRFVKWFNDPEVNKFLLYRHLTLPQERKIIRERLRKVSNDKIFLCIDTKEGEHIGVTSLDDINQRNRNATFGILIGEKKYWSKGFGTDAMGLIVDYGFKKLKLHRIAFDVYSYNKRAQGLYKKMGFKKEGVKREHNFYNGKFYDTIHMSILDREWKGRNKK